MVITQPALIYPNPLDVIPIQVVQFPIGNWRMETTNNKTVVLDFPVSEILHISAVVNNDVGSVFHVLNAGQSSSLDLASTIQFVAPFTVNLSIGVSSFWKTNPDYESNVVNRGYLNILRKVS